MGALVGHLLVYLRCTCGGPGDYQGGSSLGSSAASQRALDGHLGGHLGESVRATGRHLWGTCIDTWTWKAFSLALDGKPYSYL